jgi:hypothetical protein|tara:strand:+ start:5259 stop:5480 length:222 start_codon:yes stop_codon:yes gene_type:complete
MAIDPDVNSIMADVDEHKEKLPEGVYLKICNSLKRIHDKLCNPKKFLIHRSYVIGYVSIVSICKWIKMIKNGT